MAALGYGGPQSVDHGTFDYDVQGQSIVSRCELTRSDFKK